MRSRWSRQRGDAGSMLVELMVGMVLMAIVSAVVLDGIVGGFRAQRELQDNTTSLSEARQAAERVTREIREADEVLSATAVSLTVRRASASGWVLRAWSLVTSAGKTSLVQDNTPISAAGVAGTTQRMTVIADLDASTAPFSYWPVPQWTAPSGSSVDAGSCAISGSSPTSYAGGCIGKISVHLTRDVTGHAPVVVDAAVDLRNQT